MWFVQILDSIRTKNGMQQQDKMEIIILYLKNFIKRNKLSNAQQSFLISVDNTFWNIGAQFIFIIARQLDMDNNNITET